MISGICFIVMTIVTFALFRKGLFKKGFLSATCEEKASLYILTGFLSLFISVMINCPIVGIILGKNSSMPFSAENYEVAECYEFNLEDDLYIESSIDKFDGEAFYNLHYLTEKDGMFIATEEKIQQNVAILKSTTSVPHLEIWKYSKPINVWTLEGVGVCDYYVLYLHDGTVIPKVKEVTHA